MYLIDTHTHIYDHQFSLDRNEAMQRALDAGVKMLLLPNVDASTIAPMLELHEQYPDCTRVMMGLQPEEVKEDYKEVLSMMEKELGEACPASHSPTSNTSEWARSALISIGIRLLKRNNWTLLRRNWTGPNNSICRYPSTVATLLIRW